jgi:hypothetical protein
MAIWEDHLYIAAASDGLRIMDISDPVHPVDVAYFATEAGAMDVAVINDRAYVAEYDEGVGIVDVSIPSSPTLDTLMVFPGGSLQGAKNIDATDSVVVATDYMGPSTYIIDIRDPENPYLASTLPGEARDVVIGGSYAYVIDYQDYYGRLHVVDVSDPPSAAVVATLDSLDDAWNIAKSGDLVSVSMGSYGLITIDISTPTSPQRSGYFETLSSYYGGPRQVGSAGDYIALTYPSGYFIMMSKSDPDAQYDMLPFRPEAMPWGIEIRGDYAYIAQNDSWYQYSSGLQIIDISNPTAPSEAAFVHSMWSYCLDVDGAKTYFNDYSDLVVFNTTDPSNPVEMGRYQVGPFLAIAVSGSHAYLARTDSGLTVVDVSDPDSMHTVARRVVGYWMYEVAVDGDYLYLAGIADDTTGGLWIFDISDPADPTEIAIFDAGGDARGIVIDGPFLHLTGAADKRYRILDISDPHAPLEIVHNDAGGISGRVALDAPNIWALSSAHSGLLKFETNVATSVEEVPVYSSRLFHNYPNPFNPNTVIRYEVAVPGRVTIKVYDVTGRLMQTLYDGLRSQGRFEAKWDGRNEAGRRVASGVYFCRMQSPGYAQTHKMVLIK